MHIYEEVAYAIHFLDGDKLIKHYFPDFVESSVNVHCPFPENHTNQDSTPSLSVDLEKGVGICFRCKFSFPHLIDLSTKLDNHLHSLDDKDKYGLWRKAIHKWYPQCIPVLPPDMALQAKKQLWQGKGIAKDAMEYLRGEKRGLNTNIIDDFNLGLNDDGYITIPIYDSLGFLVNIYYFGWLPSHQLRVFCVKDHGKCRPYPEHEWPDGNVIVVEGFWDALKGRVHGLPTVTWSNGAQSSNLDFGFMFADKNAIICYDSDDAGKEAAPQRCTELKPYVSKVSIYEPPLTYKGKDLTEWLQAAPDILGELKVEFDKLFGKEAVHLPESTLSDVIDAYHSLLYIEDKLFIPVILGAAIANKLPDDPVWLMIVGPPGTAKTQMIESIADWNGAYLLPNLTKASLVSGYINRKKGTQPSLLPEITGKVMLVTEFGSVMYIHPNVKEEILSTLRQVYDGYVLKKFGTGELFVWEGKVGFIGGVTPIIETQSLTQSLLGDRFIYFRPMDDPYRAAEMALAQSGKSRQLRKNLRKVVAGFLNKFTASIDFLPIDQKFTEHLLRMATIAAYGRTGMKWNVSGSQLETTPTTEAPTRLVKAMNSLAQGIAHLHGHKEMEEIEYNAVTRIASDAIVTSRRKILRLLMDGVPRTRRQICDATSLAIKTVVKWLDDLWMLGMVERHVVGNQDWTGSSLSEMNESGRAYEWRISAHIIKAFQGVLPTPIEPGTPARGFM